MNIDYAALNQLIAENPALFTQLGVLKPTAQPTPPPATHPISDWTAAQATHYGKTIKVRVWTGPKVVWSDPAADYTLDPTAFPQTVEGLEFSFQGSELVVRDPDHELTFPGFSAHLHNRPANPGTSQSRADIHGRLGSWGTGLTRLSAR
ncbi:hypothetical protein [Brevundimonas sp.]|uniref:hypothetical protein n=1 Tax=Brevundimonas sp. TaxID=1871086 RepID=UPI0035B25128